MRNSARTTCSGAARRRGKSVEFTQLARSSAACGAGTSELTDFAWPQAMQNSGEAVC